MTADNFSVRWNGRVQAPVDGKYRVTTVSDDGIRLWVNGEEVSGGADIQPRAGYVCLESEGAPVEFKNLRIRELP